MDDGPTSSFNYNRGGRGASSRGNNTWRGGGGYDSGYRRGGGNQGGWGYDDGYQQQGRGNYPPRGRSSARGAMYSDNQAFQNGYSNSRGGGGYGGGGGGRSSNYRGRGPGYWGNRGARGSSRGSGRAGRAGRGPPLRYLEPEDVEFVTALKGHKQPITALVFDPASSQLYTGSQDGSVRVWSCDSGTCVSEVAIGGQVDGLLLEGGFLFVAMHVPAGGGRPLPTATIKVWNMATGAQHELAGHTGPVLAMVVAGGMLFSSGQDATIRSWRFNEATSTFEPGVVISAAQGGHATSVQRLLPFNQWFLSADWDGTIKVWDMSSGQCVQTLQKAHANVIMGLLHWEGFLMSCALDGTVKVWAAVDPPTPGAIFDASPTYTHPAAEDEATAAERAREWGGVLAMGGAVDQQTRSVLMASHNDDGCVRLLELPTFTDRGQLPGVRDARALGHGPGGLLVAGDRFGTVKVWRWKPATMAIA